jgi:hypothetical protein
VHNKLPPTRELDLLGRNRFRQSQTAATAGASSSSHSSFCEEVFSICVVAGIVDPGRRDHRSRLQPNEVDRTNILAPGVCSDLCRSHLLPAFTPERFRGLAQWEVVSSYSSATAPDSHGISCADPLFQARKELDREVAACACRCKNYLINPVTNHFLCHQQTLT